MIKLVFFTNNLHKVKELNELSLDKSFQVIPYQDVLGSKVEVVEDGVTFQENAIKKVKGIASIKNHYLLAEDSGLEVAALEGRPGIYSARYAGENASRQQMCEKILNEMKGCENRSAQYRAVFALLCPDSGLNCFEGVCKGSLATEMKGEGGFGYDPIFIPQGYEETFGELPISLKHQLSHRFKAFNQLHAFLETHF